MLSTSNRATLGGMVNTDASGQGSLVYGKTSDHVLGLKAVLENGDIAVVFPAEVIAQMKDAMATAMAVCTITTAS